jgi:aquaporin Z
MKDLKKYLAEFLGTCVLVLFGCGVAVASRDYFATAVAFGLSIVIVAYTFGKFSGAHLNPAVSLAMLLQKKMTVKEFCLYVVAQIAGAFAGVGLMAAFFDGPSNYGANLYSGCGWAAGLFAEIFLTFLFVYVILAVTNDEKKSNVAPIFIGLALLFVHLLGMRITGTSVNPARSLAPAILQGGKALEEVWMFIVAPLVGSALAVCTYKFFEKK